MTPIKLIEVERNEVINTPILYGQVIYCTNTRDTFYDNKDILRIQLSILGYLNTEADKTAITSPIINKLYYVKETNKFYLFNTEWKEVTDASMIDIIISDVTLLVPGTLRIKDVNYSPRTLTSTIYNSAGQPLDEALSHHVIKESDVDISENSIIIGGKEGKLSDSKISLNDLKYYIKQDEEYYNPDRTAFGIIGDIDSFMIFGGVSNYGEIFGACEKYNKLEGYTYLSDMLVGRAYLGVSEGSDGKFAVAGIDANNIPLLDIESYDEKTNVWSTLQNSISIARYDHLASDVIIKINESSTAYTLMVAGGTDNNSILSSTEYNLNGQFESAGNLNIARAGAGSFALNNNYYIAGGYTEMNKRSTSTIYSTEFTVEDIIWINGPDMNVARTNFSVGTVNEKYAVAIGGVIKTEEGIEETTTNVIEKFNGMVWSIDPYAANMPVMYGGAVTSKYEDRIDTVGGMYYIGEMNDNINSYKWKFHSDEIESKMKNIENNTDNLLPISDTKNGGLKFSTKTLEDFELPIVGRPIWKIEDNSLNQSKAAFSITGIDKYLSVVGGFSGGSVYNELEEWDGYKWELSNSHLNISRKFSNGIKNKEGDLELLIAGGMGINNSYHGSTEKYSGITFYMSDDMPTDRANHNMYGHDAEVMIAGGMSNSTTTLDNCIIYDESAWSTGVNILAKTANATGVGTKASAILIGGNLNLTIYNTTEIWNGVTWSTGANILSPRRSCCSTGNPNNILLVNGTLTENPSNTTEIWDANVWKVSDNTIEARDYAGLSGALNNSLLIGGYDKYSKSSCERYYQTKETFVETITNKINKLDPTKENKLTLIDDKGYLKATDKEFKDFAPSMIGIWSAGPSTTVARSHISDAGTTASGHIFGGNASGNITEVWNGAAWIAGPNLPKMVVSGFGGLFNSNKPLFVGGYDISTRNPSLETYSLTNNVWATTSHNILKARTNGGSLYDSNSTMILGGTEVTPTTSFIDTEINVGQSWMASDNLLEAKSYVGADGTNIFGIMAGGTSNPASVVNFDSCYAINDGVWSTIDKLLVPRIELECKGNPASALVFGGAYHNVSAPNVTEYYDSYTWRLVGSTILTRRSSGSLYTKLSGSAMVIDGVIDNGPSTTNSTEFYRYTDFSKYVSDKIANPKLLEGEAGLLLTIDDKGNIEPTTSKLTDLIPSIYQGWYVTGEMITSKFNIDGAGTALNTIAAGGKTDTNTFPTQSQLFNGATWANSGNILKGRWDSTMCGVYNSAMIVGGNSGINTVLFDTEIVSGSTWTASTNILVPRAGASVTGSTTNALLAGGGISIPDALNTSEKKIGTVWSTGPAMSIAKSALNLVGSPSNALAMGGITTAYKYLNISENFNGTIWITVPAMMNQNRAFLSGAGLTNSALAIAGYDGIELLSSSEYFDTHVWSIGMEMNQKRQKHGGSGAGNLALAFGGYNGANATNITEKYNRTDNTNGIRIVDDCNCPLPNAALSARQGGILSQKIDDITITVEAEVGELLTVDVNKMIVSTKKKPADFASKVEFDNYKTSNGTEITNLKTKDTAQDTKITALEAKDIVHETRMTAIESKNSTQDTDIGNLKTKDTAHDTDITNLKNKDTAQDTRMGTIESTATTLKGVVDGHTTKITALEAKDIVHETRMTALETKNTAQDTKITAIETSLDKKSEDLSMFSHQLEVAKWSTGLDTGYDAYYYDIPFKRTITPNDVSLTITVSFINLDEVNSFSVLGEINILQGDNGRIRVYAKKRPTAILYAGILVVKAKTTSATLDCGSTNASSGGSGGGGVTIVKDVAVNGTWTKLDSEFLFHYDILNADIKSTNVVNVNFHLANKNYIEDSLILAMTESYDGKVRIFAEKEIMYGNMTADLVIM